MASDASSSSAAHAQVISGSGPTAPARYPAVAHSKSSAPAEATVSTVADAKQQQQQNKRLSFSDFVSPQVSSYFIAGGVAGAASRTVVSPLERLKIIQQVQPPSGDAQYRGVWSGLVRMWKEEGFRGFMRGNGINCVRIIPYSAVQFTTYEQLKKWFTRYGDKPLDTPTRLLSGALAGITSVCSTYPLDLVRSRLSIATASFLPSQIQPSSKSPDPTISSNPPASSRKHLTMLGMTRKVMAEEGGVRALYRGLPATAFGVAPYVGLNFAAYESLRGIITPPGKQSAARKLTCGALAGSVSQTLTYPMDVLRRKMQVTGMASLGGVRHSSAIGALMHILRTDGVAGLYKGLWANLLKVAPSIATSFFTYELVKDFLLSPSS